METVYGLYVEGATTGEIPDFLRAEGAVHGPDPDDICYWYVPSAARARVRVWLEERSIDARYVYEFRATPDDRVDDLAAHLGIDYLGVDRLRRWVGADAGPLIAKDRDDFRILANAPALDLLAPVTRDVDWVQYEKVPGFWHIHSATELPEPIEHPAGTNVVPLTTGMWEVDGDGRSVISRHNLDHLNQVGIAYSTAESVNGTVYPRRRFPVFSERLVQVAKRAGVDLVIHLPYEGYEIEPW